MAMSRSVFMMNPLLNAEVVSTVFSFCSVDDLKNCRLVGSKLWLNESLKYWRERAVLIIKPKLDADERSGIRFEEVQRLYTEEGDPSQVRRKPFRHLQLEGFRYNHFRHSELFWLFGNCADHVRYLALKNYEFSTEKCFMDTILLMLPNLVALKLESSLRIRDFWLHYYGPYPEHKKLKSLTIKINENDFFIHWWRPFDDLLPNIADLHDLQIKTSTDDWGTLPSSSEAQLAMWTMYSIRCKDNSKLRLKNLHALFNLFEENGREHGDEFITAAAGMPLERYTGTMSKIVYLNYYSETLKFLKLHFSGAADDYLVPLERASLPNLKEFHAHGLPNKVFRNLNNIDATNLETLVVEHTDPNFDSNSLRESVSIRDLNASFGNVTKLECYSSTLKYVIDLEDIQQLAQCMPNVKHAKMPLTREAFRELCRTWPGLLTLTISDKDGRITGIDDETITGVKPYSKRQATGCRPPNITDLKCLTDFTYSGPLTTHSVNFGFLSLPRLHYLDVNFRQISRIAKSALKKKVSVLQLRVGVPTGSMELRSKLKDESWTNIALLGRTKK